MSAAASCHPKYRTKLCRNLASGNCPFGEKCSFVHPPRILPPSLLSRRLVDWNVLLPQILALSNKQVTLKRMPRTSPPRFQGPRVVDEDPSPPASLLLSASDGSSPEQLPQTKRTNKRKKYPCRHFLWTGGWCPAGTKCGFYHDVASLPSAAPENAEQSTPSENDEYGVQERTISGGVLMGVQVPSPPIIRQEPSESSRYTEAQPARPYQRVCWPSYTWRAYQPYHATAPAPATVPVPVTAAPSSLVQHSFYPPLQSQVQTTPPSETKNGLPPGTYEVNGTMYFPPPMPIPVPIPATYPITRHPTPYGHAMAPLFPYYAPPALPPSYYGVSSQTMDVHPPASFDPFGSDPMIPSELPFIPRLDDYQISPVEQNVLPLPLVLSSAPNDELVSSTAANRPVVVKDQEFPYRPPRTQRAGHARRISVDIKQQVLAHVSG